MKTPIQVRAELEAENKALRERAESAEASFKERDLQMRAALEETESMFQRTQRAEAENVELREAKEKAEALVDKHKKNEDFLRQQADNWEARADKFEAACAEIHAAILSVLCDPEGVPCFVGSDGDRAVIAHALSLDVGKGWCSPEDKAKLEADAAELRHFISTLCDLRANPNAWPTTFWASTCGKADRLLGLNHCGQPLLDRMKAMEDILKDCQHLRSQVFPLACFPECPACRWEAMKEATA